MNEASQPKGRKTKASSRGEFLKHSASVILGVFVTAILAAVVAKGEDAAVAPPYPSSKLITNIQWDRAVIRKAKGSDNWPITWADDNNLYTAYGDGRGFEPKVSKKLSLGFAKIIGSPDDFRGVNIRSPTGEERGDGRRGKKASGMLMVAGVLYMWVRNADPSQLAWSSDHGKSWTWSRWKFAGSFGYPCFLNFGKNYAGARDGYVYVYSPDTTSAYTETDRVILARATRDRIKEQDAYEFFQRLDSNGRPVWSKNFSLPGAVFRFPGGCNRLDVTFNAPLGRHLLTMRSRGRKEGGVKHFSIYDAPDPWGPWTTVYYENQERAGRSGGWGESQHIPSKWISPDGKGFYLIYSGGDSFSVRKAVLSVEQSLRKRSR